MSFGANIAFLPHGTLIGGGQLGLAITPNINKPSVNVPSLIPNLTNVVDIYAGGYHSMVLLSK